MWDLPRARDRTHVPCIGRQILNHCATMEVPKHHILAKNVLMPQAHAVCPVVTFGPISAALLGAGPSSRPFTWARSLNPQNLLMREKSWSPPGTWGNRPERGGTWRKVTQLGGSKGSTETKTSGSQSRERGGWLSWGRLPGEDLAAEVGISAGLQRQCWFHWRKGRKEMLQIPR